MNDLKDVYAFVNSLEKPIFEFNNVIRFNRWYENNTVPIRTLHNGMIVNTCTGNVITHIDFEVYWEDRLKDFNIENPFIVNYGLDFNKYRAKSFETQNSIDLGITVIIKGIKIND